VSSGANIYRYVFLPFAATLVVTMIAAWWTAASLIAGTLEARLHSQLTHATTVIASGTFPFTVDLLERIAELQDADFALLRSDGSVGLSTFGDDERASLTALVETSWRAGAPGMADGYDLAFAQLPTGRGGEYVAVAGLTSLAMVRSAAQRSTVTLGLFTLAAVAVLGWWAHRRSVAITRPIRDLVEMARRIASGDRSIQVTAPRIQEIAELAGALNEMTAKLSEYQRDLLSANRLASLGEVTSRVAHEIRNPLTAIKLQLQLLGERLADPDDRKLTQRLLTEIRRLELIVSSTLAFGRPLSIEPVATDLNTVIEEVTALLAPQFAHLRVAMKTDLGAIPRAHIDADRMKQVLFNLLTNAADALPEGGTVRIATVGDADGVRVDIEDSGPGMDPDVDRAAPGGVVSTKPGGFGLGLAVSREIVTQHGGTLIADRSPALGGARFTIRLPGGAGN
jgi:signal transduction histidine kinase